jgi:cytochrome c biogenesis factor
MMIWKIASILWMAAIIVSSFLFAHPATGFPGQTSRILFFHVPQAWVATLCFLISTIGSCMYLKTRRKKSDNLALSAAELGFLFCSLAMVTGSIFAKARVELPGPQKAFVTLAGVDANAKIVHLNFTGPGPEGRTGPEKKSASMVAEVSIKPGMTVLWLGVVLILLGGCISLARRRPLIGRRCPPMLHKM